MSTEEKLSDFFVEHPMLVPAWKVTAIRTSRDSKKLRFTSNVNIRVDIVETKEGVYDIRAVRGIYKVKNKIDLKKVGIKSLINILDEIIAEFFELNRREASAASRGRYDSKKFA